MIFLDLETRSRVDIKQVGGHRYVRDEGTELLCGVAVHVVGDELVVVPWSPNPAILNIGGWECQPETLAKLGIDPRTVQWSLGRLTEGWIPSWPEWGDGILVAHNAEGFDRPALEHHGLDPSRTWVDTAHRARQSGLPAGLDRIGEALFDMGKDKAGAAVLKRYYKPIERGRRAGEFQEPNAGQLAAIVRYCARDVLLMVAAWRREGWGQRHPDDRVREVHCAMDRRGLPVDLKLAQMLYDESERLKDEALARAAAVGATADVIASPVKLKAWLSDGYGYTVEDIRKATMRRALSDEGLPEDAKIAIEARLACTRVTQGKAARALYAACPDGRLRGTTAYWGAHTGRWAGRLYQVQNLPSPVKGFTEEVYAEVKVEAYDPGIPAVAASLGASQEDVLSSMLRGVLVAEPGRLLCMMDYSQIEARVLLWLAEDEEGLDVFRQGRDIYRQAAAGIYRMRYEDVEKKSLERTVGKVATLALGYQGGPAALQTFATNMGVDLAGAGIDAREVVEAWRDANAAIAGETDGVWTTPDGDDVNLRKGGLWKEVKQAAWSAMLAGSDAKAGRCLFRREGQHLAIELPSGRPLIYRNAMVESVKTSYGVGMALAYDSVRHGKVCREGTYGGRLVENITQAVARDVMAEAMVKLEDAGLRPMFTVHDEVICSIGDRAEAEQVRALMEEVPSWATGLPLKAEGDVGERYGK